MAQQKDGYLNTYFTVKEPEKRWTNLQEAHELYCAGHMIEAAVAYAECTGKSRLLEIMCGMADHIYKHFIEEGAEGYPGHPEIELALMRLFRCTKEEKYKELALHFINVRGVDSDYFIKEKEKAGWTVWRNDPQNKEYEQNYAPVREQDKSFRHCARQGTTRFTAWLRRTCSCSTPARLQPKRKRNLVNWLRAHANSIPIAALWWWAALRKRIPTSLSVCPT